MNFLVFFITMNTQTLQQAQQEVQDLKFEILEQAAAENFDWTRRIFRRTDRTASTNLRIKVAGWTLTTFRRHFNDCPTIEAELSEAKPIKAGVSTVSKSPAESAQGFTNSHLNGQPKQKKRKARKRQKTNSTSQDVRFNTARTYCESRHIKKEVKELSLESDSEKLQLLLDFGRHSSKTHGGIYCSKFYESGTCVSVVKIRAVYRHDWNCPTTTIFFDTVKLFKDPRPQYTNLYVLALPWDREEDKL